MVIRKRFIVAFVLAVGVSYGISYFASKPQGQVLGSSSVNQPTTLWQYQCIDTMKFSRDAARDWGNRSTMQVLVDKEVAAVASLGANCVAIATPYDEEFWPYMTAWVSAARKNNLSVWFRGNMSGWENWFDYPTFTNVNQHHAGITKFITANPGLFTEKDIFSPSPEAENGKVIGNPWASEGAKSALRKFAVDSTANCVKAFEAINKKVACGYFSANGDVVEKVYNKDTIKNTGGVSVTDHYVKTSQRFITDIYRLYDVQKAPVFIGEFGAPIPDIHGSLSQEAQAKIIDEMFYGLYKGKAIVKGVNYWVLRGGSTALLNDNFTPKLVAGTVKKYFKPHVLDGYVLDVFGNPVIGASVRTKDQVNSTTTFDDGSFRLLIPDDSVDLIIDGGSVYKGVEELVVFNNNLPLQKIYTLQKTNPSTFETIKQSVYELF